MANYAGTPPAPVVTAPAPVAAPATGAMTLSQAMAPPAPAEPEMVLPAGVEREPTGNEPPADTAPAFESNPWKFSANLESHLVSVDVEPQVAKFFGGRILEALQAPAPSAETIAQGHVEAENALSVQFGDDAEAIGHLAREEVKLMARDFPDLVPLLERTGLGNDLQVIKAFAGRAHDRLMAQQRTKFGLPPKR